MFVVGIDIGGTFTDCAVLDEDGTPVAIAKSPSVAEDPSQGVLLALEAAGRQLGLPLESLLADTSRFAHGSTVGTNVMIERKGARVLLLTTRGFEDTLFIGRVMQKVAGLSEREIIHQSALEKAVPVVPRHRAMGVSERVDAEGAVVAALDVDQVRELAERVGSDQVEAVAITFLWSFLNPTHEQEAAAVIRERHPDLPIYCSHDVAPIQGEYERTVTTVLSAYIGPKTVGYLATLARTLRESGYRGQLFVSHSLGGLSTIGNVRSHPLVTVDSGPAGGVLAGQELGVARGEESIICTDMGGTSFDVGLIEGGEPELDEDPVIGQYSFLSPKILIRSIGAGGGSIVWVDEDQLLHVGPQSAGAAPGPACYGNGGTAATITDAALLLGYLGRDSLERAGRVLSEEAATAAMDEVARALGWSTLKVAAGAFQIINAHMADLVRQVTINRGFDPRRFVLYGYGGAGPMHCAFFGRELGVKAVRVPASSGVFSALGIAAGPIVRTRERSVSLQLPLTKGDMHELSSSYRDMTASVLDLYQRDGIDAADVRVRLYAYLKYGMQPRELAVELPTGWTSSTDVTELGSLFERRYAALYGAEAGYSDAGIELRKIRVDGMVTGIRLQSGAVGVESGKGFRAAGERRAHFDGHGFVATPVFDGSRLQEGAAVTGPAIIERPVDTLVIPFEAKAHVDTYLDILITFPAREPAPVAGVDRVGRDGT